MSGDSENMVRMLWAAIKRFGKHAHIYIPAIASIIVGVIKLFSNLIPDGFWSGLMLLMLGVLLLVLQLLGQKVADWDIKLKELTRGVVQLDAVLENRHDYREEFHERLIGVRQLWIQAVSAENILGIQAMQHISNYILSQPDGDLRIIVQDPQKQGAVQMIIDQLEPFVGPQPIDIPDSIASTLKKLSGIRTQQQQDPQKWRGRFEYRLLSFSPGFNLVIIDPDGEKGVVIPEFYGFRNDNAMERMHIEITKQNSKCWFDYWKNQFEKLWEQAERP